MSPRRRGTIPEPERIRLLEAMTAIDLANTELRNAVLAARNAEGSVRSIAQLLNKSTNTIQRWAQEAAVSRTQD